MIIKNFFVSQKVIIERMKKDIEKDFESQREYITKSDFHNDLSWTPPSQSGLNNSQPLIKNKRK